MAKYPDATKLVDALQVVDDTPTEAARSDLRAIFSVWTADLLRKLMPDETESMLDQMVGPYATDKSFETLLIKFGQTGITTPFANVGPNTYVRVSEAIEWHQAAIEETNGENGSTEMIAEMEGAVAQFLDDPASIAGRMFNRRI